LEVASLAMRRCVSAIVSTSAFQLIEMGDIVKILTSLLAFGLLAAPALAETKTFDGVSIVDVACSKKAAANADAHTRECALDCKDSGFAIVTADNQVLKLDADGNAKVLKQLKASDKADHLRVNVSGDVEGDTLKVTSIKLL
jgi:hypothetical protein